MSSYDTMRVGTSNSNIRCAALNCMGRWAGKQVGRSTLRRVDAPSQVSTDVTCLMCSALLGIGLAHAPYA